MFSIMLTNETASCKQMLHGDAGEPRVHWQTCLSLVHISDVIFVLYYWQAGGTALVGGQSCLFVHHSGGIDYTQKRMRSIKTTKGGEIRNLPKAS